MTDISNRSREVSVNFRIQKTEDRRRVSDFCLLSEVIPAKMYEIKVTDEFSGAHNLRHYKGKCEALHGHNWKVEVAVSCASLNKAGMIMDFKDLKNALRKVLDDLDHTYLNDIAYFKKNNPTSEHIAHFVHAQLSRSIKHKMNVSIWETSSSCASFEK